jgi:PAS domain S-box-containing protein
MIQMKTAKAQLPRLSLRAKGVAGLFVPMAALFAALYTVYWVEAQAYVQDQRAAAAYATDRQLLELRVLIAANAQRADIEQALARIPSAAGDDDAALDRLRQAVHARNANARDQLMALSRIQEARIASARYTIAALHRRLFVVLMICGIVGPLGALFVHLLVFGRLAKRLHEVEVNAHRMAHGLPLKPYTSGRDEISELASQIEDTAFLLQNRERRLRESEQRYRDLFDQAPVPYEETDRDGMVRRFNQAVCDLLKCGPDRVLGRKAWDFAPPDQQDLLHAQMLERIAKGVDSGPYECEYLLEDGSSIAVEIRENLIRNENGEVTGVCRSLLDVTQRNLAAMAARKVEQYAMELRNKNEQLARALDTAHSATLAKSRFLAAMSHELRTPLNGIIGFSEVMFDGKAEPVTELQREFLGDILTSAKHLLELINDILDLSKVEAGKMEFRPEPCVIATLVREVCEVVSPLARKKNILLDTNVPAETSATIDPSRFKQVLYNYLSNAVKFTPEGGSVKVIVSRESEDRFRLDVIDTGIGIPPDELPLLFQEFQQLADGKRAAQGTGLGLSLTRHIVEAQGGSVAVNSTIGLGSTFSAVLPFSTDGNGTNVGKPTS